MRIAFDERELARTLLCGQIEMNNKPTLLSKTLSGTHNMLVVVDMVKGFCVSGALADPRMAEIAPTILHYTELLPSAQKVIVRDCHAEQSAELKYFPPHCIGKESERIPLFKHLDGIEVKKNSTNAFVPLVEACGNLLEYDNILVTGVCTDICVLQLALSLRAYISERNGKGNVVVFTDAVETYDSPTHNADLYNMTALKLMEQSGVLLFKTLL